MAKRFARHFGGSTYYNNFERKKDSYRRKIFRAHEKRDLRVQVPENKRRLLAVFDGGEEAAFEQ